MKIADLTARQIFDSRGEPTVEVQLWLRDGSYGVGSAPAGASTGSAEVAELRDGGDAYGGRGVQRAIEGLRGAAREAILGMDAARQDEIDARLREIEAERPGTLGGNGRIAASWAVADAAARSAGSAALPMARRRARAGAALPDVQCDQRRAAREQFAGGAGIYVRAPPGRTAFTRPCAWARSAIARWGACSATRD